MTRGGTHRSIARIVSCAAAGRESVLRFPIFRSNTPTKPRVKGEALLRLVAEAAFPSARSWSVAGHRAGYLRELLRLLRGVRRFKPNLFDLHLLSHYLRKLDSV